MFVLFALSEHALKVTLVGFTEFAESRIWDQHYDLDKYLFGKGKSLHEMCSVEDVSNIFISSSY